MPLSRLSKIDLMLATVGEPFSRPDWLYELKYDGFRALVGRESGRAGVRYRGGSDATAVFPELVEALEGLRQADVVLDGEIVVVGENGRPSFERLQQRSRRASLAVRRAHPVCFFAFDVLSIGGRDVRETPLLERKRHLRSIVGGSDRIRYVDHITGDGLGFFNEVKKRRLEGVVAKRAVSVYRGGRSREWLKWPVYQRTSLVVVGFTKPGTHRIGGLHVATSKNGRLLYAGTVGLGFAGGHLSEVRRLLQKIACPKSACDGEIPKGASHTWVEPRVMCDVRFKERTSAGLLRQPVFAGWRPDLSWSDRVRE